MVAAKGDARPVLAIIIGRAQADTDPGAARDGSDLPHQHDRMEESVKLLEAGSEVGDLDRAATGVVEPGDQDRGVDEIVLLGTGYIEQVDGIEAEIIGLSAGPEQRAKHRITIETRHASPDHLSHRIDQGAIATVSNQCEIEAAHAAIPRPALRWQAIHIISYHTRDLACFRSG